jgi:hypothetical protein
VNVVVGLVGGGLEVVGVLVLVAVLVGVEVDVGVVVGVLVGVVVGVLVDVLVDVGDEPPLPPLPVLQDTVKVTLVEPVPPLGAFTVALDGVILQDQPDGAL